MKRIASDLNDRSEVSLLFVIVLIFMSATAGGMIHKLYFCVLAGH